MKNLQKNNFLYRIAHGFLTASFISTIIATELPGPGSIYLKQSLKFLAPVYINERILIKVRIIEVKEKSKVKLITECFKNKTLVLMGEAEILIQAKNNEEMRLFRFFKLPESFIKQRCNWKF